MTSEEILDRLRDGNARYVTATENDSDISAEKRKDTAENGQHPYAVVIACADSRVVPEDIFLTGIGELFVIRVAGNVIGDTQMGSVEYAVEHLGCPVVIVLGHTRCGAVGAALEGGGSGYVKVLTDGITRAIGAEKDPCKASALNAQYAAKVIHNKLADELAEKTTVLAAIYDVDDGHVDWL